MMVNFEELGTLSDSHTALSDTVTRHLVSSLRRQSKYASKVEGVIQLKYTKAYLLLLQVTLPFL
jgi:hypothetical protein